MFPFTPHTTLRPDIVRAVPYFAHFEGCLVEGCLVEGCLVEGCLVEGCLVEGCLVERDGLRPALLRSAWPFGQGCLVVRLWRSV
ncbi:Cys-every-fifth RiPP peptide CefA [Moorena sp. SIO1G6]|uniref:Cys-every-fifth RiPP peptide CefA n=1 Tax=Moorena sp. SIO1G6 TaxID=2607840 RepID=UPI00338F23D6